MQQKAPEKGSPRNPGAGNRHLKPCGDAIHASADKSYYSLGLPCLQGLHGEARLTGLQTTASKVPFPCLSSFPTQGVYNRSLGTCLVQLCSTALNCSWVPTCHSPNCRKKQQLGQEAISSISGLPQPHPGIQQGHPTGLLIKPHLRGPLRLHKAANQGRRTIPCWLFSIKPGWQPFPVTFPKQREEGQGSESLQPQSLPWSARTCSKEKSRCYSHGCRVSSEQA